MDVKEEWIELHSGGNGNARISSHGRLIWKGNIRDPVMDYQGKYQGWILEGYHFDELVAFFFMDFPQEGKILEHINDNILDCRVSNLRWV